MSSGRKFTPRYTFKIKKGEKSKKSTSQLTCWYLASGPGPKAIHQPAKKFRPKTFLVDLILTVCLGVKSRPELIFGTFRAQKWVYDAFFSIFRSRYFDILRLKRGKIEAFKRFKCNLRHELA